MIVDFHTHWYPEAFFKRLALIGRPELANARTQPLDLSARVAEMDQVGVDRQVLSFVGLNVEMPERAGGVEAARLLNDLYRDARDRHPGRFDQFTKVPLPWVDEAVAEAVRGFDELGAVGVALPCSFSGHELDDPAFDPFWAELDARRTIAFIHPVGEDSRGHWGMNEYGLDAMFGSPMQIALAATRLVFSGVTKRFPNIKFLLAQGGGTLLSRWHAIETILNLGAKGHVPAFLGWTKELDLDAADPMLGFRSFFVDTAMMDTPATLMMCKETLGIDRVVLGSDMAFGSVAAIATYIRDSEVLSDAEKTLVLETNTSKLLMK